MDQMTNNYPMPDRNQAPGSKPAPKKRKLPKFYLIYFICIGAALFLLCVGLLFVNGLLKEYESVQIKHAEKEVFDEYFADFSYDKLKSFIDVDAFLTESGMESEEELFRHMSDLVASGEASYYRLSANEDNTLVTYAVTINKKRVATFTLKQSKDKTANGFSPYELDTITVINPIRTEISTLPNDNTLLYTYLIKAPSTHTVKVNGEALNQENGEIVYDKSPMASSKSGFAGIPFVTYEVIMSEVPEVEATDRYGNEATFAYDEELLSFTFPYVFDQSVLDQHGDYAIEAAKKLAIYMQAGGAFKTVSPYYDPSSELYTQIYLMGNDAWMVKKFDSCEFENASVSEGYRYSDTEFSLRVKITQIGHKEGRDDSIDHLDYTFVFHLVNDQWLIFESYNN